MLIAAVLAACGTSSEPGTERTRPDETGRMTSSEEAPAASEMPKTAAVSPERSGKSGANVPETKNADGQSMPLAEAEKSEQSNQPINRKIIRDADLSLESESPDETQKKITEIVENKGGFVVETQQSSSNTRSSGRDTVTMTIRIPAEKFSESLDEIRMTANRILIETVKGQDVTEEFIDIEARLKAKRALETQFLEIMKRANSVEDALKVESQLSQVRTEIEQIEGRKRFLENRISLSTMKLRIQTPAAISASGRGFFYRLTEAVSSGFEAAMDFILGLITVIIALLPFFLFIGLPGFLGLRYLWRRFIRRRTAREIAGLEIED